MRAKREKIGALRDMNAQAEKQRSYGLELDIDFQRKYAGLVLEIEKLNRELNQHLLAVQQFCQEVSCAFNFLLSRRNAVAHFKRTEEKSRRNL